jgi:hypothetical protein
MLDQIYIIITDKSGDTALKVSEGIGSKAYIKLLQEPYVLGRLVKEAEEGLEIKGELDK